jgi:hypothetical protein
VNKVACAVVGNSGTILKANFGAAIDSHPVVVRHAPCDTFVTLLQPL